VDLSTAEGASTPRPPWWNRIAAENQIVVAISYYQTGGGKYLRRKSWYRVRNSCLVWYLTTTLYAPTRRTRVSGRNGNCT